MPADPAEIVRPSTRADIPALSALFTEVFGTRRDASVWEWKYFSNPRGTTSMVCEAGGRLVAHTGGTPVRFRDFDREYVALQSVDFMSSPSYPGGIGRGGVFIRTADRFFEAYCGPSKIPLVYGFPGERHRILGEKLLGYRPVERVGELHLEPTGSDLEPEPLTIKDLAYFGRIPIDLGAVRDEVYLRWRYLEHPLFRYAKIAVPRPLGMGTQIAALVRESETEMYVMELAGRFSRSAVGRLTRAISRTGKPAVFWGSPAHPVVRLFTECGFRPALRDHWIEFRTFEQRQTPRGGQLYYTLGDYDVN